MNDEYLEIVHLEWIGAWKSFRTVLIAAYMAYKVLCMEEPHKRFGLTADKPFVILNMGISARQAKNVVFTGIRNLIKQSPWFKDQQPEVLTTEIRFWEILTLMSWNSTEEMALWMNVFTAVIDESSFYPVNEVTKQDRAYEIFTQLSRRIRSRFWRIWKMVCISSPNYDWDFTEQRYEKWLENENTYVTRRPTWRTKNRSVMSEDIFIFDYLNYKIVPPEEFKEYYINPWKTEETVVIDLKLEHTKTLEFWNELDDRFWIVPYDFYSEFVEHPEKASRDLGCKKVSNLEWYIKLKEKISDAMKLENKVDRRGIWDLNNPIKSKLYIHIDTALNRNWKGDAAWFAVAYCDWFDKEWRPVVNVEWIERITAWQWSEIQFSELRARILNLRRRWFKIGRVTLDGFQSADTMQLLRNNWIKCEYLSVDRDMNAYSALKEWLYADRIRLARHTILKNELENLVLVNWKKVDHPPKWSKDVSDAVAWAVYNTILDNGFEPLNVQIIWN